MDIFGALLSRKDSNLVKQNQNLLCYHYTTGQSESENNPLSSLSGRKGNKKKYPDQIFMNGILRKLLPV